MTRKSIALVSVFVLLFMAIALLPPKMKSSLVWCWWVLVMTAVGVNRTLKVGNM
jgi:hypothetical protein